MRFESYETGKKSEDRARNLCVFHRGGGGGEEKSPPLYADPKLLDRKECLLVSSITDKRDDTKG